MTSGCRMGIERREIAEGYQISRLIKGGWQLAGGHGPVDRATAIADMGRYVAAGITTFDCADIYTGVEEMIGAFRREALAQGGADALAGVRVHTKFVPDLDRLADIDRAYVRRIIDRSLQRLGVERLDLVQFHWWDYMIPRYVETGLWLAELQREGKIALLGGTNWDTARTAELLDAGVPLRTMQVQYSVLDARPEAEFVPYCERHGIVLFCYGTVAGGFLSERWLGAPEQTAFENRSLVKYKLIIDDIGGWPVFQRILAALAAVARRHGVHIATVAKRYVLDRPLVAGAIVGVLTAVHFDAHRRLFELVLDADDHATIEAALSERQSLAGDVYALERDRTGRHGRVMKYNLAG
jgi:aryl-alcohol dehydrogenase-like predicted oxidoreductase